MWGTLLLNEALTWRCQRVGIVVGFVWGFWGVMCCVLCVEGDSSEHRGKLDVGISSLACSKYLGTYLTAGGPCVNITVIIWAIGPRCPTYSHSNREQASGASPSLSIVPRRLFFDVSFIRMLPNRLLRGIYAVRRLNTLKTKSRDQDERATYDRTAEARSNLARQDG